MPILPTERKFMLFSMAEVAIEEIVFEHLEQLASPN